MDQSNSDSTGHPVNGAPVDPTPEQPAQPANGGYAVQTVPPLLNQQNPNEAVQPTSNVDKWKANDNWRSSTSLIFWGVIALTVLGCAASVFEFIFSIINSIFSYIGTALDLAGGSSSSSSNPLIAVHDRLAVWTRIVEVLTIGGWVAYVMGISKFRLAQLSDKARWLTSSLYTACWLGLIAMGCSFIGSFLGMFGLFFTFAGWVLNLISLFKFYGAFNQLSIEETWNDLAKRGARNLKKSYTCGIVLAFMPLIVTISSVMIILGSIGSAGSALRDVSGNGLIVFAGTLGGSLVFLLFLALVALALWVYQLCLMLSGWGKIKCGSLAAVEEIAYTENNSTLYIIGSIVAALLVTVLGFWNSFAPLGSKGKEHRTERTLHNWSESYEYADNVRYQANRITTGEITDAYRADGANEAMEQSMAEVEGDTYTYQYSGSINGKYAIEMTLSTDGGDYYTGEYCYTKNRTPILLNGRLTDGNSHLELEEYVGDKMTGTFAGVLTESGYRGTWTSADGTRSYPFSVTIR